MLDWVRELLGAQHIRLATEEELQTWFDDCEVGAIPALRHWGGIEVIADAHLQTDGYILILGGTHRDAVRMDGLDQREHLLDEPRREPERRFVEDEERRFGHQPAADGEHLLLATRQRARALRLPFGQPRE